MTARDQEIGPDDHTVAEEGGLSPETPALAKGTSVGRYLVAARIGRGGMGEVYQAFDPDLNRPVALKLLTVRNDRPAAGDESSLGRSRLLREAQALAQLAHPNVVTVFDVGTYQDAVFMAMELVEGQTLQEWLKAESRAQADILAIMKAAGAGLAAAHEVGIVHRDFKPANVIIGSDGRVRVLDFGLARAVEYSEDQRLEEAAPTAEPGQERMESLSESMAGRLGKQGLESSGNLLSSSLTQAGAIVGTPNYMAPEQHHGLTVDERSDQFSFAVVLFEALYGQRPFQGRTFRELVDNVTQRNMVVPAEPQRVPAWIQGIVHRGLALDPLTRFDSMTALLAELEKDPERARRQARARRRRWLLLAGGLLSILALSAFGFWYGSTRGARLCQGAASKLTGRWDDPGRRALQAKFLASGRSYADDTYRRVRKILDQKTEAWVAMRTEACQATQVHGSQSAALLDRRMTCLDQWLAGLGALVRLWVDQADGAMVDRAIEASLALDDLARCADKEALLAAYPPPRDAALATQVKQLRGRLDQLQALNRAGKYRSGLELGLELTGQAQTLDYPPLSAKLLYLVGDLQSNVGDGAAAETVLRQAILAATRARDDLTFARALNKLMLVIGHQQAKYQQALLFQTSVEAAVIRAGEKVELAANADNNLGILHWGLGQYDQAKQYLSQSLAAMEKSFGKEDLRVSRTLNNLGSLYGRTGDYATALRYFQRNLQIDQKILGPSHPSVAMAENNLGLVFHKQGRYQEARQHLSRSLQIWEQALGPDHPDLAMAVNNLGMVLLAQGETDAAMQHYQRALKIREGHLGPDHPSLVYALTSLGIGWLDSKKPAKARPYLERALKIRESHPTDAKELAETRFALARALGHSARHQARALGLARQAAQALQNAQGQDWLRLQSRIKIWLKKRK